MCLLLMPRSIEVFSPLPVGLLVPSYRKLELLNYLGQSKFFSPCLRGGTFLLIARWNLLLIKSANFRVHSSIQPPSTSTVQTSVSHSSGSRSLNRGSCCTPKFALFLCAISYQGRLFHRLKIKKNNKEFLMRGGYNL